MPSIPSRRAVHSAAILAALTLVATPALAAGLPPDSDVPTGIAAVANSPVIVTKCALRANGFGNALDGNVVVGNRTKHEAASVRMTFVAYDAENTRIDQQAVDLSIASPITSRDIASAPIHNLAFRGDASLIARVACRVQAATFSGNKHWTYGETWPEKNLTLMADDTGGGVGGGSAASPQKSAAPRVQIVVTNAWVDTVNGVTFVHDALAITGGSSDAQLRGSDFSLAATLTNGARKAYTGLTQGAPTYQKLNPLGSQTATAYEVDPNSDLGRLGTITVPAHGAVSTTVTFGTSDPVNTSDIRTVTVK